MSEHDRALPDADHHEGGFRPIIELLETARNATEQRGGPHYGPFIEQVRTLMDRARLVNPDDDLALEAVTVLEKLNDRLAAAVVDEWSTPSWTRFDLPARGLITLPEYTVTQRDAEGTKAHIVFRDFHLGGNQAAHGGYVSLGFDDLMGVGASTASGQVTRTASLTVDYRAITPLNKELLLHAWAERQEGRKVFMRATLHDGDTLCAEAHGLFLVLKPGQA